MDGQDDGNAPTQTPELDEIWERIRKLELEPHLAELEAYGLTVIPPEKAAPPGFTDRLTETILRLAEESGREAAEKVVPLEAPAGSLAVWHGNTWHGAFPRTVPGLRLTLITSYFRSHLRTQELYRERVTEEMLDRNPPRFATLMGQHVTFGWEEDGPDYARFMKYAPDARPGVNQHS